MMIRSMGYDDTEYEIYDDTEYEICCYSESFMTLYVLWSGVSSLPRTLLHSTGSPQQRTRPHARWPH